jgi:hypothetical protein
MKWRNHQHCTAEAHRHVDRVLEAQDMRQYEEVLFDAKSLTTQLIRYVGWDWGTPEMQTLSRALFVHMKRRT